MKQQSGLALESGNFSQNSQLISTYLPTLLASSAVSYIGIDIVSSFNSYDYLCHSPLLSFHTYPLVNLGIS
ncbi:hypothetical protein HKD37_07G017751 [Glycine soja]